MTWSQPILLLRYAGYRTRPVALHGNLCLDPDKTLI